MKRTASHIGALAIAALVLVATQPVAAQSADPQPQLVELPGLGLVYALPVPSTDPHALPRLVNLPGFGDVYLVPFLPLDTRPPKQACIEEQIAKVGGAPSQLEQRVIDLKCSQR
jgi:hypothetical protein